MAVLCVSACLHSNVSLCLAIETQRCQSPLEWGSWIRVNKISIFPGKFPRNLDFFRQFHKKIRFSRQIFEKFRFFQAIKKFDFPGKNCSFTATSGQIILFLFNSHHFRTYFLCMIRYSLPDNNIPRPVHDPHPLLPSHDTPCTKSDSRDPQPPGLTPMLKPGL